MTVGAGAIASVVLEEYDRLPAKRKPAVRDNGLHEWVPLSGIVAQGIYEMYMRWLLRPSPLSSQVEHWLD